MKRLNQNTSHKPSISIGIFIQNTGKTSQMYLNLMYLFSTIVSSLDGAVSERIELSLLGVVCVRLSCTNHTLRRRHVDLTSDILTNYDVSRKR